MLASPPRPTIQAFFKEGMKSANIEKRFDIPSASVRTMTRGIINRKISRNFDISMNMIAMAHAPRIAESLQRHLLEISELPGLLGKKFNRAKTGASESGTDPEEVESLGIALVQSYVPIIDKKKGIIADLLRILTDYTVSHELNEMERSFEESTLQEEESEVSPPRITLYQMKYQKPRFLRIREEHPIKESTGHLKKSQNLF
ncbi:hypothetical protein CRE_02885 [Caenorhabditis remanei]|uniref:Uncharacterized protein n=1 Tax=Caenorhabditis remanei TaxID=31234 RepID=E3LWG4_CAERE|nr:hypothetical protein CRE_02885 [Caenorhabditis remanei]